MSHTQRIDELLSHYRLSHQHPRNEAIHCVAVPVIMASLVGPLFVADVLLRRWGWRW